jgi:DNA-binding NarL/FixJ family response regulator
MPVVAKTVSVLLVDDQESFRSAARLGVGGADGFELVGEAETAEEGLDKAQTLEPDLVLMDINLPGMDGLEATRRLAADKGRARVIVLSTYEAAEYEERSLEAGAVAFMSKSDFEPDALRRVWEGCG